MASAKMVPLSDIVTDEAAQPRAAGLDGGHVADMVEYLSGNPLSELPAVVAYRAGSSEASAPLLSEGYHRVAAYALAGRDYIPCELRVGTRGDAILNGMRSNQAHGLKRTSADKRRAVGVVLSLHPEWADNRIAEFVGVSNHMVADARPEPQLGDSPSSGPAKRVGRDGKERRVPTRRPDPVPSAPDEPDTDHDDLNDSADGDDGGDGSDEPAPPAPAPEPHRPKLGELAVGDRGKFDSAIRAVRAAESEVISCLAGPGGFHLRRAVEHADLVVSAGPRGQVVRGLSKWAERLADCQPLPAVCAACSGAGGDCPACAGAGASSPILRAIQQNDAANHPQLAFTEDF